MKYFIFSGLIIILSLTQCNKDDCNEEPVEFKTLEADYGCVNSKYNLEVNIVDNVMFIRADEFYDSQVGGGCHPDIDFTKYDLVIGRQGSSFINDTILFEYERGCPAENLNLKVTLVQSNTPGLDTVVYNVLLPKLQSNEKLNVTLEVR